MISGLYFEMKWNACISVDLFFIRRPWWQWWWSLLLWCYLSHRTLLHTKLATNGNSPCVNKKNRLICIGIIAKVAEKIEKKVTERKQNERIKKTAAQQTLIINMRIECFMPHLFFSIVSFSASLLVSPHTIRAVYKQNFIVEDFIDSTHVFILRPDLCYCCCCSGRRLFQINSLFTIFSIALHTIPSLFEYCFAFLLQSVYFLHSFGAKIHSFDSVRCYFNVFCIVFFLYFRTPLDPPYRINLNNLLIK